MVPMALTSSTRATWSLMRMLCCPFHPPQDVHGYGASATERLRYSWGAGLGVNRRRQEMMRSIGFESP